MRRFIERWQNMVFRNFRFQVLLRVSILIFLIVAVVTVLTYTDWRVTPIVCIGLLVFCVSDLIHYVEHTNRTFTEFLNSIYYQDFSTKVPANDNGTAFSHLSAAYKLITDSFRRISYQKEAHLSLLEAVVDHLQVSIICVDGMGHIKLINTAAKRLFKTPHIHHIDGLRRIDAFVYRCVNKLQPGEQQLISANIKGKAVSLSVVNNEFSVEGQSYKLLSFNNIRDELEQKESDAWQKLIRVLAHEIMNSATPILSLSSSIKSMLTSGDGFTHTINDLSVDEQRDLVRSLDSIESRSKGLIHFVDAYRGLTQIPEPKPQLTDLPRLIQNVTHLLMPDIVEAKINLQTVFDTGYLQAKIDPQQIEQVLINLLRNAIQALEHRESPKITISVKKNAFDKIVVDVEDNGTGISGDNLANIFMPFYTTKAKGTGVGLSISRQIMFMNRGLFTVESTEGEGSRFRLEFST